MLKVIDENRPVRAHVKKRFVLSNWLPFIDNFGHHRQVREELCIRGSPPWISTRSWIRSQTSYVVEDG
jgi:hypothetical protein